MKESNILLSRLPPELEIFLKEDSVTLLIKGAPGTGKTTLALEILKVLSKKGQSAYLSTRLSIEKISRQFPWVKEDLSFEKLGFELMSDVRLITPEFFITTLGRIIRGTEGCIVLDSWDAIANELDPKERMKVEKALVNMADSSGSRLIFVSEEFGHQSLDYIADGVVSLRQIWAFGKGIEETHSPSNRRRSAREIEIEKLRGVPIYQRTYLFTLSEGRFTCLLPYRPETMTGPTEAIPDLDEWHISTGVPGLDEITRGLPRKGFFLLEIGKKVGLRFYPLLFTMIQNAFLSGRGAIMLSNLLPPPEFRKSLELSEIRTYESAKACQGAFKMVFLGQTYEETALNYTREYERLRHQHKEVIEFIDLNAIEGKFGLKETVSFLSDAATRAFESKVPSVLLVREGMDALELTSRIVAAHIVIHDINGALVTYGISPRSGMYGIVTKKDQHHLIELM